MSSDSFTFKFLFRNEWERVFQMATGNVPSYSYLFSISTLYVGMVTGSVYSVIDFFGIEIHRRCGKR